MTNAEVMLLFLSSLIRKLDGELLFWRDDTVFLLDGAKYHVSDHTRTVVMRLGLKVIYSGPYSYSAAPAELLFRCLKMGELNKEQKPTTKR